MAEKQRALIMNNALYEETLNNIGIYDFLGGHEAMLVALASMHMAHVTYMKTFLNDAQIRGQMKDWTNQAITKINRSKN